MQRTPAQTAKVKEDVIQALRDQHGIVTAACKQAHIDRRSYYKWMKEDPDFKDQVEAVSAEQVDIVENKLWTLIEQNHPAAIFFYLKCKGKWTEQFKVAKSGEDTEQTEDTFKELTYEQLMKLRNGSETDTGKPTKKSDAGTGKTTVLGVC